MIHFQTTKAIGQACHSCHRAVLAGFAEGLYARVDLTPVTDEAAALLAGRQTYTFAYGELIHRDAGRIAARTLTGTVLAEHQCAREANT